MQLAEHRTALRICCKRFCLLDEKAMCSVRALLECEGLLSDRLRLCMTRTVPLPPPYFTRLFSTSKPCRGSPGKLCENCPVPHEVLHEVGGDLAEVHGHSRAWVKQKQSKTCGMRGTKRVKPNIMVPTHAARGKPTVALPNPAVGDNCAWLPSCSRQAYTGGFCCQHNPINV